MLTSKGDFVAFDGADAERCAVGADNQGLVADSSAPVGVKWVPGPLVLVAQQADDYTAKAGERVPYDATTGDYALKAPAAPSRGAVWSAFEDGGGTGSVTIDGNGDDIESPAGGFSPSFVSTTADVSMNWVHTGTRWKLL